MYCLAKSAADNSVRLGLGQHYINRVVSLPSVLWQYQYAMGNETSLSKAALKPGYFVTYSFSPVISVPIQPSPEPIESEEQPKIVIQSEGKVGKDEERVDLAEEKKANPEITTTVLEDQLDIETTQTLSNSLSQSQECMESPELSLSTVDYSDVSAARAALLLRLKASGKVQPLSNGDMLEAMYRNKRKKTQAKGATGEVESIPQQSVASLRKQFSAPSKAKS